MIKGQVNQPKPGVINTRMIKKFRVCLLFIITNHFGKSDTKHDQKWELKIKT